MKRRGVILLLLGLIAFAVWLWFSSFRCELPPRYTLSPGSQTLTYPIQTGTITAGYQNPRYRQKNGFSHYGTDFAAWDGKQADVLSIGEGTVLGTEFCDNSIGNILVARYDGVFDPATGETVSVIARYYHLLTLTVKEGEHLTAGQVIGTIDGRHPKYHHIHLELDTDLLHPFHTPQVAEASSELLIRYPATGERMIDPVSLLVVGRKQKIEVHPNTDCGEEQDQPRFYEREFAK